MAKGKKKKVKTSKELANSIDEFLKGKKTNWNNLDLFEKAIKRTVKRGSK